MTAPSDQEFLRLLKQDIEYFKRAVERFENLIPHVSASVQDQWRLQAQARRDFEMNLELLLIKAEAAVGTIVNRGASKFPGSVSC